MWRARRPVVIVFVASVLAAGVGGAATGAARATGHAWPLVTPYARWTSGFLRGVSVVSGSDAWAVGLDGTATGATTTLILHWNGTAWSKVKSPSPSSVSSDDLDGVSAVSGSDAWAVGVHGINGSYADNTLILHWNGTAWTKVKSPSPGCPHYDSFNFLYGVSARSGRDAWAAGNYDDCTTQQNVRLVARWNGRAWADASAISTVTSVSSSSNPVATGNRVTYTATVASKGKVTPGPQGRIGGFYDNGSLISSCSDKPVSSGSATCRVIYPSAGSHAIKAHFFGHVDYVPSTSASLTETATSCGAWRWPVKTGSDADRSRVSKTAARTSIRYLAGLVAPSSFPRYFRKHRFRGAEWHTWLLTARLTQFRLEDDGDIRLVLRDGSGRHMIAEIPAPGCVANSSLWKAAIKSARASFTRHFRVTTSWHYVHRKIIIRGLGFFDQIHDITGQARNGIELHPVTGVRFP